MSDATKTAHESSFVNRKASSKYGARVDRFDLEEMSGDVLIRISIPWVVEAVATFDKLDGLRAEMTPVEWWSPVWLANHQLQSLLGQSLYKDSLVTSRMDALNFGDALQKIIDSPGQNLDAWKYLEMKSARDKFKTVFLAELATLPAYFVRQKPPYNTSSLLDHGESLMPSELLSKVPTAIFDVQEAGKCLAFELGTAAAFHLFRALESVVRAFHKDVCHGASEPKQRNLGVYIRALEKGGADAKVVAALKQIKDLHRNPIAHPEAAIGLEEAMNIAGLVRSAVASMLVHIPVPLGTTTTTAQ